MDFTYLLDKNGKPSSRRLSKMTPEQRTELVAASAWLPIDACDAERLYVAVHKLLTYPRTCKLCGNGSIFSAWGRAYTSFYCSQACAWADKKNKPKKIKIKKPLLTKEERLQRQISTNMKRYGVPWSWMLEENKEARTKKMGLELAEKWIEQINGTGKVTALFTADDYKNSRQYLPVSCNTCGSVYQVRRRGDDVENTVVRFCETCFTKNASPGQHNLAEWIKSLGFNIRLNDRKVFKGKHELDIWIPDKNLVIEYDGLYWHAERGRPDIKNVCALKCKKIRDQGINLISVFEDDWELKQEIIKSRIKNQLGIIDQRIYARKCVVKIIKPPIARAFFTHSHLQGFTPATTTFGLEYQGELVAMMSFGRPRFNKKKYKWELLRFATKPGVSVIGGASKLFAVWRADHLSESIISFSDNRWGSGTFYEHLGFKSAGQTPQGYFYVNSNGHRKSRQSMMKHKLAKQLKKFDPALSERQNCWNNGWYRAWDLGNTRWVIE